MYSAKKNIKSRISGAFFVLLLLASCSSPEWKTLQGEAIGTTYTIQYLADGESEFTAEEMDSLVLWMNHALSTYQKNSLISSFNSNDNSMWQNSEELKFFEPDMKHLINMLVLSATIYEATDNAFDPTAEYLYSLWNEAKTNGTIPDSAQIKEALKHQGFDLLKKDPNGFPFKDDVKLMLNFNAIAKGYLVDEIGDYLRAKNISNFMIEIGGEVAVSGLNPAGKQWTLGINTPTANSAPTDVFKAIELDNQCMATSGNYRNFYEVEGKVLGHTIDPRTGWPVNNNLKSATVIHKYCAVADAYATACMVLGLEKAKEKIEADSSLSAYFIYEEHDELKGIYIP